MAKIYIGTSGWHYDHWVGVFYPKDARPRDFLPYYAARFGAVEINNTFYQLPARETLRQWREAVPASFVFACKSSRYITHMKKLKDPVRSVRRFFEAVDVLGEKLGPVLFQLPPGWHANAERLEAFLGALPHERRYAFEFRDDTWFTPDVYEALGRHGAAFCVYDLGGKRAPVQVTTDFAYVRLHGPDGPYQGSYDGRALYGWARRFRGWKERGWDVYCFFDNDEKGYAALNAQRLSEMLARV